MDLPELCRSVTGKTNVLVISYESKRFGIVGVVLQNVRRRPEALVRGQ